jgi:hypothetical protein
MLGGFLEVLLTGERAQTGQQSMSFTSRFVFRPRGSVVGIACHGRRQRPSCVFVVKFLANGPKLIHRAAGLDVLNDDLATHAVRPNAGLQDVPFPR